MATETVKFQGTFHAQQVKANGSAVLIFRAPFIEVANTVKAVMAVQRELEVNVFDDNGTQIQVCKIGMLHNLKIDNDGESVITIITDLDDLTVSTKDLQSFVGTSITIELVWEDES